MVVLFVLQVATAIVSFVGVWAVLFLGRYPKGMEEFIVNVGKWNWRINSYFLCLTDKYPPFGFEVDYPADLSFEHQEESSRLWALLTIIPVKTIMLIPHLVIVYVMMLIGMFVMVFGLFATLFTGKYPMFCENYVTTLYRYTWRLQTYMLCLTDQYPPMSWKA
jgi:hypothetical protein